MNSENASSIPPEKSKFKKQWKSQSARTGDSVKKLTEGVDLLKPFAQKYPGESLHRTDIPYRIRALLRSQAPPNLPRCPMALLHSITAALFERTFRYEQGAQVNLEDVWKKLMASAKTANLIFVEQINNEENRKAFFWQIAGHAESYPHPLKEKDVCIVQIVRGPRNGKLIPCFEIDGKLREIPEENPGPWWPVFLCLGDYWKEEPVFNYTVANMSLTWPSQAFEEVLKMSFWEPSKKTLQALEKLPRKNRQQRR